MEKDFDTWNGIKKKTNDERRRFYTVREMWWCRLGVNVGTEQDGKEARVNLSQLRVIDSRRLEEKILTQDGVSLSPPREGEARPKPTVSIE